MIQYQNNKNNFLIIFTVVIFALTFYSLTFLVIKNNIIQYSSLPKYIHFKVKDAYSKDTVVFELKVISKLKIDTPNLVSDSLLKNAEGNSKSRIFYKHMPLIEDVKVFEDNLLFHQNPAFLIWIVFILLMMTCAAGSFPVFLGQTILLIKKYNLNYFHIFLGILFTVLLILFLSMLNIFLDGYYKPDKMLNDLKILLEYGDVLNWIVINTILLVSPIIFVIFLIGPASENLTKKIASKDLVPSKKILKVVAGDLEELNQLLNNSLQILAIIIVFSIFTSSALGESIRSTVDISYYNIFPKQLSYVYGLSFTLFLLILYVPVYLYLKTQYNGFKNFVLEVEDNDEVKESNWSTSVLAIVKIENSALDNIKLALTVLAPLISSFLPEIFNFVK